MKQKQFVAVWVRKPGNAKFWKVDNVLPITAASTPEAEKKARKESSRKPTLVLTEREAMTLTEKIVEVFAP